MRESSQVGVMWESSIVRAYSPNFKIKTMHDNSMQIIYYDGSPRIITPNNKIKVEKFSK
jgi:hypothetical protein